MSLAPTVLTPTVPRTRGGEPGRNGTELVVGIGDLQIGRGGGIKTIVTHALGSCVGVFAWDPETKVGGCLHYMLPKAEGTADPDKFGDTGLPRLIRGVAPDKAAAMRLRIIACGGASMNNDSSLFRIGPRNITALKQFMWNMGLTLTAQDLGGNAPRTGRLDLGSGRVTVDSGPNSTIL